MGFEAVARPEPSAAPAPNTLNYLQMVGQYDDAKAERRRHALLQAAAIVWLRIGAEADDPSDETGTVGPDTCAEIAEGLLDAVERREAAKEGR
jgi:hypothetical protein